jgi:hypothetical protein
MSQAEALTALEELPNPGLVSTFSIPMRAPVASGAILSSEFYVAVAARIADGKDHRNGPR